jgi:hypothetical protein
MKRLLLFVGLILCFGAVSAQKGQKKADNETNEWRYEVEVVGTGVQGTYQIKVWTYSGNQQTAINQAQKNAVHAIIFKGFPARGGVQGQKALARDPMLEQEQEAFFKEFFKDGGTFQKYVFLANNGIIAPGDMIAMSKKEYKVGVVVSVNVAGLRKNLEEAGIIKSLSNGF